MLIEVRLKWAIYRALHSAVRYMYLVDVRGHGMCFRNINFSSAAVQWLAKAEILPGS